MRKLAYWEARIFCQIDIHLKKNSKLLTNFRVVAISSPFKFLFQRELGIPSYFGNHRRIWKMALICFIICIIWSGPLRLKRGLERAVPSLWGIKWIGGLWSNKSALEISQTLLEDMKLWNRKSAKTSSKENRRKYVTTNNPKFNHRKLSKLLLFQAYKTDKIKDILLLFFHFLIALSCRQPPCCYFCLPAISAYQAQNLPARRPASTPTRIAQR